MQTLVIYGSPPTTTSFKSGIKKENRKSFERLLVPELEKLAGQSLQPASVRPICHTGELATLLRAGTYDAVAFYGHAATLTTDSRLGSRSEILLFTACGEAISAKAFADALLGTSVREVLLAGCSSNAFAADLSTRVSGVRFGGIPNTRVDTIAGNDAAITVFQITPQPVKWWRTK